MIKNYINFINEKSYFDLPFKEGDRIIVTKKKSKNYKRTGTITYCEIGNHSVYIEVLLDYSDEPIGISYMDIDKIESKRKITPEDPLGEEIWDDVYENIKNYSK
jgi:hypothetical protein